MALPALGAIIRAGNILAVGSIGAKYAPKLKNALSGLGPKLKNAVSGLGPKIRSALPQNVATALGIGGGAAGGFGLATVFDELGIEDERFRKLALAGLVVGAIFAVGQLFNFDVQL